MKYLSEFRTPELVKKSAVRLRKMTTKPWKIMEVCGGQTHSILRYGLDTLLPPGVEFLHGPGCPVCVTPAEMIDAACALAEDSRVILASFGDMLRVPGHTHSLTAKKAAGGDVRVLYSPLDALALARDNPGRQVVFLAVGFETTVPVTATLVLQAAKLNLNNLFLLTAHVRVPPALRLLLSSGSSIHGLLAPGHVCTIMGTSEYQELAEEFRLPVVVTGFEPLDIMQGVESCLECLEAGKAEVRIAYSRSAKAAGSPGARQLMEKVFQPADMEWRGVGRVPAGGLVLRPEFERFDARKAFSLKAIPWAENHCLAGKVLRGDLKPDACPEFSGTCTPDHPLGAPMVSAEGACAAYFRYRRRDGAVHA